jgi:hypothetical protein
MARISLLAVLIAGVLACGSFAAEAPNTLDLDGREVAVRVYENWRQDPRAFEKAAVEIEDQTVGFDLNDVNEETIVVILADEQEAPNIRAALGDTVYAELYKPGLRYKLGNYNRYSQQNKLRQVVDGLGNPVVGTTVEVYLRSAWPERYRIALGEVFLEDTNLFKVPIACGSFDTFPIVLSHADYGTVHAEIYRHDLSDIIFPVLKADSNEYERSIWGTVVDPEYHPVPGVSLRSCALYPPGGGRLTCDRAYGVVTDEQGRFSMYLPLGQGKLVPTGSEYEVSISAPKGLRLRSPGNRIRNGRESTIVLRPKLPGNFHTFIFEDEDGRIADVNTLKNVVVTIDSERGSINYLYHLWKDGGIFPPGKYQPVMKRTSKRIIFEPVMVTADSPEELVFKARYPQFVYSGRVVHAITGEPMPRVIVLCTSGQPEGISLITAEQWQAIHGLGDDFCFDSNALAPLRKDADLSMLTRTGEQGGFHVNFTPGKDNEFRTFAAVEEGYLVGHTGRRQLKMDQDNHANVPDIKLFPAAKIVLEPQVEKTKNPPCVRASWRVAPEDNPEWADALPFLRGAALLSSNAVGHMDISAGFNVQVTLRADSTTEKPNPRWSPIIIKEINVKQGETLDLGALTFEPTLQIYVPIYVEVIDSLGEPVEGVTVRHVRNRHGRRYWDNTGVDGIATFSAPTNSAGEFSIYAHRGEFNVYGPDRDESAFKQSISYEIAGPEDANNVYTLRLSDEILKALFKADESSL